MAKDEGLQLGRRIAPPRFIAFALLFAGGFAALLGPAGPARATLASFDAAAAVFLLSMIPLLFITKADVIRDNVRRNDANRTLLLALTAVTMLVVLVAVAGEVKGRSDTLIIVLVITTLVLAWFFSNVIYATHYAHLYYTQEDDGTDLRGLDFPDCDEPTYWEFFYFSFTLGMTFQTSDVAIRSRQLRRIVLGHCLAAFAFNIGVLAFTINVLGG